MVFLDPVLTSLDSTETILPYARTHAKICIENKSYLTTEISREVD